MTVLTRRALNRALLTRQLLLERSRLGVVEALEQLVGLQSQAPRPPYFGLLARLEGFTPSALSTCIENRSAVRLVLMRGTVHLVSARDAKWLRPTLEETLASLFERQQWRKHVADVDVKKLAKHGRALVEKTPLSLEELGDALSSKWPDVDSKALAQTVRIQVPLVQVPPRGLWGVPGQARCTSLEKWLGALAKPQLKTLVKRYLAAFGPATVRDAQVWSSARKLAPVFESLRGELVTFTDEQGRELFDVPDAPRPDEDTVAPVRLLAEWEQSVLSYEDRSRILGDRSPKSMMTSNGIVPAIVLVDGFVRGHWKLEDERVKLQLDSKVTAAEKKALAHEAQRVEAFVHGEL